MFLHSVLPIAQLVERQTVVLKVVGLVDIETSLTQLVECQPHELKVVGSIPIRGTSCLSQFSYDSILSLWKH